AGGLVPIATATDGGGSTRIPAACCGLGGLKPSRGRISQGPALGDSIYSNHGVVTRTVRETAQLLDVMAGYEPGGGPWAPPPGATRGCRGGDLALPRARPQHAGAGVHRRGRGGAGLDAADRALLGQLRRAADAGAGPAAAAGRAGQPGWGRPGRRAGEAGRLL